MLNNLLNMAVRHFVSRRGLRSCRSQRSQVFRVLYLHVHLPDSAAAAEAAQLIEQFGGFAADEAAARAGRSRELGNVIHYCRWRQIQRLIEVLGEDSSDATVH